MKWSLAAENKPCQSLDYISFTFSDLGAPFPWGQGGTTPGL